MSGNTFICVFYEGGNGDNFVMFVGVDVLCGLHRSKKCKAVRMGGNSESRKKGRLE